MRINLGLCKRSEIYLIQNFRKHCRESNGIKTDLAGKDISNKLMIFGSDRKKWLGSAVWQKKAMLEKNQVEVCTLLTK